jgi:hypothetical protein
MIDREDSRIDVFAIVGPRDGRVVGGIAGLSDHDYQTPTQRLLRGLADSPNERVKEVILILRC